MSELLSADQLLQFLTQALYFIVFLSVGYEVVRRPRRISLDIALFFGALAVIVSLQWLQAAFGLEPNPIRSVVTGSLFMALPYLLLRLVDDFTDVPRWVMRSAEIGLAITIGFLILLNSLPAGSPQRALPTLVLVVYFVVLEVYAAQQFVKEARRTTGVTSRRMQAAAAGSILLGVVIVMSGANAFFPDLGPLWTMGQRVSGLLSGMAYALAFTPPRVLRRAWQEPELRAFLGRAAELPRLPNTAAIVQALEGGAAASIGAPQASIGLWLPDFGILRYTSNLQDGEYFDSPPDRFIAGRAFTQQQPIFSEDAERDDPENAESYRTYGAKAVLAAPITAGDQRLGVLSVFAARSPIFADDDLGLVQLLADQAAVILESRKLIDEASRVQALEEATRLRDDFLSAAAHDLKTPLTALLAQAQLLQRRAERYPSEPIDRQGLGRLVDSARKLNSLMLELLDAARAEQGRLLGSRDVVDLVVLANDAREQLSWERHHCTIDAPAPVLGLFDRVRITQLIANLLENAVKYSPDGGSVEVRIWQEQEVAHVTVTDHGIGIPASDLPHVFERFRRGKNVDDRRFSGMGLGLFICRAIVGEHGGGIEAVSRLGQGTTMHVRLPVSASVPAMVPAI
ncbi:MAG TPA: ATP-binding protein [Chloroflexota bacterium]|nr:ATP-binding protein [Chloroflexota bacterium]